MDAVIAQPAVLASATPPHARLAGWLTLLLAALFCLNTAGGWVRLSGSGVAIPHWPLIELDGGTRTLLPPLSAPGWAAAHDAWAAHQTTLRQRIEAGTLAPTALGRQPATIDEFRTMFLIEWFHRLLAAGVGVLALACLGTVLRDQGLRRLIGVPVGVAVVLIGVQALIGAALIDQGTSTRWLFLHQGNAALILGCVLVAVLRLLDGAAVAVASPVARLAAAAAALTWVMLMLGGLLAASRHLLPSGGVLGLSAGPLWWPAYPLSANLLDNASLHHIAHRIGALAVAGLVVAALFAARRHGASERVRLALQVAASFVAVQAVLGITASITPIGEVVVPLAHLFLGHVLFLLLVLAWHDARRPMGELAPRGLPA